MGLFDSTSSSSTDASQAGAQTQDGAATTIDLGGSKNNVNISLQQTDQGAVDKGFKFAGDIAAKISDAFRESAFNNADVAKRTIDGGVDLGLAAIHENAFVVTEMMNATGRAYEGAAFLVQDTVGDAFAFGRDAIASNQTIAREALYQSQSVVDLTEKINSQNTYFLQDVNAKNNELIGNVTGQVVTSIADLSESAQIESSNVIKTIKELAETVQTGGENITTNANKYMTLAAIALAALIGWRALR